MSSSSSRPPRRKLLVAKIGVATITYTMLASPIACNLPAPSPNPDPGDARPAQSSDGAKNPAAPTVPGTTNGSDR